MTAPYMSEEQVYSGLNHLATVEKVSRAELVEGVCGAMLGRIPLDYNRVRPVLERDELHPDDLAEISLRYFEAAACSLFPGIKTAENHFAHSYIEIALMAKTFEHGHRQSIAEGWGDLAVSGDTRSKINAFTKL